MIRSKARKPEYSFKTYLSLRGVEEEAFVADEIRPAAKQRLERSLIVDSLIGEEPNLIRNAQGQYGEF